MTSASVLPSSPSHFLPSPYLSSPPSIPLHSRPKFTSLLSSSSPPHTPIHRRVHSTSILQSLSSQASVHPHSPLSPFSSSSPPTPPYSPTFHTDANNPQPSPLSTTSTSSSSHWTIHSPHQSPLHLNTAASTLPSSPKPPSPPLNHTNTLQRTNSHTPLKHDTHGIGSTAAAAAAAAASGGAAAPAPALLSQVQPSKRSLGGVVASLQSEESRGGVGDEQAAAERKDRRRARREKKRGGSGGSSSGSSSGSSTPSPPPPSPSLSPRAVTVLSPHSRTSVTPYPIPLPSPPALSSPGSSSIGRTTSLPVAPHTVPVRSSIPHSSSSTVPAYVAPAPPTPPTVALLHASFVYVRTASTLLNRWQKRWLILSQTPSSHPSTAFRLALYNKPGDSHPVDLFLVAPTSSIIPSDPDKKPCRVKVQLTPDRMLSLDTLTPHDRTQWLLSLQQAILLTQHAAAMSAQTAASSMQPLTFPSSPSPKSVSGAGGSWGDDTPLTPFQANFFHLHYNLPEVGYTHAQYEHALQQFRQHFPTHEAILTFLLEQLPEEEKTAREAKGGPGEGGDEGDAAGGAARAHPHQLHVNEAGMTAWLSTKFSTTSLPSILLAHTLALAGQSQQSNPLSLAHALLHPHMFSTATSSNPSVVVDSHTQTQVLLSPHTSPPLTTQAAVGSFHQRIHSSSTLHHLSPLLYSSTPARAALSFRLLWLILANVYPPPVASSIFSTYMAQVSPAVQGSEEMSATLRALLFSPLVHQQPGMVGLRTPFLRPHALPALFACLSHTPFTLRAVVLKDVSSCLLNPANVSCLASLPSWQSSLLSLLTDVHFTVVRDIGGLDHPRHSPTLDDGEEVAIEVAGVVHGRLIFHEDVTSREDYAPQRAVYQFVHNIFAVVHYRTFLTSTTFPTLFASTLDQLFTFGGPRVATQRTAVLLVHTLLNLIDRNVAKRAIMTSCNTASVEWKNFAALLSIVRVYVFLCHHWIATDTDSHTYTSPASHIRMVVYQCKFRHPAFVPFAHLMQSSASAASDTLGVHFDEEGAAADAPLVQRVLGIMQELKLDEPPPPSGYSDADRTQLQQLHSQFCFFDAALEFLTQLQARLQSHDVLPIKALREAVVGFMEEEQRKAKESNRRSSQTTFFSKGRDLVNATRTRKDSRGGAATTDSAVPPSSSSSPPAFTTPSKRQSTVSMTKEVEADAFSASTTVLPSPSSLSSHPHTPFKSSIRPLIPPTLRTPIRRQLADMSGVRIAPVSHSSAPSEQQQGGGSHQHVSLTTQPPPSPSSTEGGGERDSPVKGGRGEGSGVGKGGEGEGGRAGGGGDSGEKSLGSEGGSRSGGLQRDVSFQDGDMPVAPPTP